MKALGHQNCIVKTDSKVIADHIEKESEARKPELIQYLETVRAMEKHFRGFTIIHIPRAQNDEADRLAKAAARKQKLPPDVFFEEISTPSTRPKKETRINAIFSEDWRAPIMAYFRGHYEPTDEAEEKRLSQRARGYVISHGELYKSGGSNPLAKMHPSQSRHQTSERDPRWHLRIPHRHQTSRSQGIQAGFFLAICAERRRESGQNLRSLPKVEPKIKQTFETLATDSPRLAPPAVGTL